LDNEHPHITIDLLRRVYNHRKAQFVQFIKHILGIEILESFPETVSKAFDDFIAKHSYLTSRQVNNCLAARFAKKVFSVFVHSCRNERAGIFNS
jgi:hypothetical protein